MLKKRLIGVITVRNELAVQSIGYKKYLPLGSPQIIAENLDRWGVDEIFIQEIDRSLVDLGPNISLIKSLGSLSTPLIYGGGVHNAEQAGSAIEAGVERICVDYLLHSDIGKIEEISREIGAQAMIVALPLRLHKKKLLWRNHVLGTESELDASLSKVVHPKNVSEILVIDWVNEGFRERFEPKLIELMPKFDLPLIAFGGISEPKQIDSILKQAKVAAVAVGNFLNYTEHAVQVIKEKLIVETLRDAQYSHEGL